MALRWFENAFSHVQPTEAFWIVIWQASQLHAELLFFTLTERTAVGTGWWVPSHYRAMIFADDLR